MEGFSIGVFINLTKTWNFEILRFLVSAFYRYRIIAISAGIAQLVEQRIRNAKVGGSSPLSGTKFFKIRRLLLLKNCARMVEW